MASETSSASTTSSPSRHALVVCDMQPDFIKSITSDSRRMALIDAVQMAVHAAQRAEWTILFTKLEFPKGYKGVPPQHKLYGAFQRLNAKLGDDQVHWFMEGYEGSKILPSLVAAASSNDEASAGTHQVICRPHHMPPQELVDMLQKQNISNVTLVGLKAGYSVQATCQVLCDVGMQVTVVRECVADDNLVRQMAILNHLIPIYANIIGLVDFMDETVNLEVYEDRPKDAMDTKDFDPSLVKYCCDCGRGGHGPMYMYHLLERPECQIYPRQQWYIDFMATYFCPLGKRVIQFCDEPQFSDVSMYVKGREWLDEKEKLVQIAGEYMPKTFLSRRCQWAGEEPISDDYTTVTAIFVGLSRMSTRMVVGQSECAIVCWTA